MIINIILMIFACIAFYLTVIYARDRKSDTLYYNSMLTIGILAFIICLSYSVMGITYHFNIARIARIIGIFGIDCFLVSEMLLVSSQLKIKSGMLGMINFVCISVSVLDMLFFGNPNVAEFTYFYGRTCYYAKRVWQRTFHSVFIILIACGLIWVWYLCLKKTVFKREKNTLYIIFWSNIILLFSTLPDTFLPLMGYPSWPSTPIGVFIAYIAAMYATCKYMSFDITENAMYNHIYHSIPIGCITLDLDFQLAKINDSASALLDINESGFHLSDMFLLSKEEVTVLCENLMREGHIERKLITKKTNRNTLLAIHVEKDGGGNPYCYVGTIMDMAKEDRMLNELNELNESKALFLMHMSHEIRTPVNTILGMNEMIIKETEEPRIRNYAENIKSSCKLLISIINDILDFSKIESGELNLSENNYSLQKMVNELISMVEDRTNKKGLSMVIDIDENLPGDLYGDEMKIRQIVTNLLTNAVKYTDYGLVKLRLSNEHRENDILNLRVDVIDTGKGIRDEDKARLFKAFRRVDEKKNRHIEGTGLGLSITSHFVSLMGGTIGVESEYGKGSDFYVIIPQKVMSDEKIGRFYGRSREMHYTPENKPMPMAPGARVLIVDDNDMNLTVASLLLQETKMSMDLALDGKVALAKMRENAYDLIMLDHMMPGMDGIQVLKNMRREGLQEGVPVIALTANAISGAREMYLEEGFDDYISKPIELDKMNEVLEKWVPKTLLASGEYI